MYFTGKGDDGLSKIKIKKKKEIKLPKNSPILDILGELDELNSLIGFLKNLIKDQKLKKELTFIQNDLFIIQANFAWLFYPHFDKPLLKEEKIKLLEEKIKKIEKVKPAPQHFVIPGSNLISGIFDYLRAKTRTVERKAVNFKKKIDPQILAYLNRLSSYFFALARLKSKKDLKPWY